MELGDESGSGTLDFDCDFVGLDVGDGFVEVDPLSLLLDELSDGALVDGVGEEGEGDGLGWVGRQVQAKKKAGEARGKRRGRTSWQPSRLNSRASLIMT
jgi:hypothetical protein